MNTPSTITEPYIPREIGRSDREWREQREDKTNWEMCLMSIINYYSIEIT